MPREHQLKTWPPFFRAIVEGRKTFELRRDDRAFDEGDVLVLREYEPMAGAFTGACVRARVTYVMRGGDLGIERGFAALGLDVPETYSPATEEKPALPPPLQSADVAGDVPRDSQEDPELRDQVASADGSDMREGPAHAPEQDREAGVQRPAGSAVPGEGATASPAAAWWGRVGDTNAAWHLWRVDAREAECGEATDAAIEFLPVNVGLDPERVCLDCRDISERAAETTASDGTPNPEVAGSIPARPANGKRPCARCSKPTKRVCGSESTVAGEFEPFRGKPLCHGCGQELRPAAKRCAGHNKSADVPCNTAHVHVERDGKWFCKRHDPAKPRKAVAA